MKKEKFIGFQEFRCSILNGAEKCPSEWRKGQSVFNIIDDWYDIAREVQYEKGVDCFYDDSLIDEFIIESYNILKERYEDAN